MKKSIYILGIILIVVLLAFILFRSDEVVSDLPDENLSVAERSPVLSRVEKTSVTVYYLSENGEYLLPLSFDITATTEAAKIAVEKLLAGPPVDDVREVLLNNSKVVNFYSIGQSVILDLTADFVSHAEEESPLALSALAATILPLSSSNRLTILIDGQEVDTVFAGTLLAETITTPYINLYGQSKDIAAEADFVTEAYHNVVCYLPTSSGQYLVPFTSLIAKSSMAEDSLTEHAKLAVTAMLSMPELDGIYSFPEPIPQLLSLQVIDYVAYCDFDDSLLQPFGKREEGLFQRALVRTLTSLEGINSVQLLVNGEIVPSTASGLDIYHPLTVKRAVNSQWDNASSPARLAE